MTTVFFQIDGEPLPKQRPKFGKGKAYTPDKTRDYEKLVSDTAGIAMLGQDMIEGDVHVALMFYRKNNVRADLDNLAKAVLDGIQGVVFADDKQVVQLSARVAYGSKEPCVKVTVVRA